MTKRDVSFGYTFNSNITVKNLQTSVDIVATLAAPQVWSKSFDLLQTEKNGNFSLDFPLDITSYTQLLDSIRSETGVSPNTFKFNLTTNIHVTGETPSGPLDKIFSPNIKGTITGGVLTWDKELGTSTTGAITQTTTVDNAKRYLGFPLLAAKILFIILTLIFPSPF